MILNTQQIILLCLLVSFVTSIATGITVVSLLQQTPEPVSQTINRVIERTVESVASNEPIEQIKSIITNTPAPDKEVVTVVVNQEDQTINAVTKNEGSIARIYTSSRSSEFVTLGVVLNKEGDIAVDKRMVSKILDYTAQYGARSFPVRYKASSETDDFVVLRIEEGSPNDFVPASLGDSSGLRLAQSVISLSGSGNTSVSTGAVTSLATASDGSISAIRTSVDANNVLNGSVLLNLQGLIVGIKTFDSDGRTTFLPVNAFKTQVLTTQSP